MAPVTRRNPRRATRQDLPASEATIESSAKSKRKTKNRNANANPVEQPDDDQAKRPGEEKEELKVVLHQSQPAGEGEEGKKEETGREEERLEAASQRSQPAGQDEEEQEGKEVRAGEEAELEAISQRSQAADQEANGAEVAEEALETATHAGQLAEEEAGQEAKEAEVVEDTLETATHAGQLAEERDKEDEGGENSEKEKGGKEQGGEESDAMARARERMERFRTLRARAKESSEQNMKEARAESRRQATDPSEISALRRRREAAERKLERAGVEEAGEDFERKRAWDWTVEESEAWDRRVRRREARRDDNAFQDYRAEANKVYRRQVRAIQPDMDRYERDKMAAIDRAAAAGGLDIVETETGELIAVDRDGSFYSTADSTLAFSRARPDKAAVDRLVADLRKAEEVRLKHRRDRLGAAGDDADVTYINEKNKQFNQKLARFYNKYTAEIRESFERGTMI